MNAVVSQVSQYWEWERTDLLAVESLGGYKVRALCVSGVWIYSAYSPEEKIIQRGSAWFFRDIEYKLRYEIGERVPPAYNYQTKRAALLIGCFREDTYGNTDAALAKAKAACVQDFEEQQTKRETV